jgi:hypothetical protein
MGVDKPAPGEELNTGVAVERRERNDAILDGRGNPRADKDSAEGKTRLTVAPRLFGNARVAATPWADGPTLALATHLLGPRPADLSQGHFTPSPFAATQVQLRVTLSGPMPAVKGLSYRALANYAFADRGPYVVGPVTSETAVQRTPQLIPVDRFRTTVGLAYEF